MKLIKNIQRRKMAKFKARTRIKFKTILNEKIESLSDEHSRQIDAIIKRHDREIDDKNQWFEKQISIVRDQERKRFDSVIFERDKEIEKLKDFIAKHKQQYDDIEQKEIIIDDTVKKVNQKFERGFNLFSEGFQIMKLAEKDIFDFQNRYVKKILKIQEAIRE